MTNPTIELWTIDEVARRLRVADTTVRRWIKSGALPAIPLPRNGCRLVYRVTSETMARVLEARQ